MLENRSLDVNKLDHNGVNSFYIACRYGHGDCMRALAEKGADIFCTDKKGYGALHLAAKYNYSNIITMLIDSKFPLDMQTNNGDTAVAIAA